MSTLHAASVAATTYSGRFYHHTRHGHRQEQQQTTEHQTTTAVAIIIRVAANDKSNRLNSTFMPSKQQPAIVAAMCVVWRTDALNQTASKGRLVCYALQPSLYQGCRLPLARYTRCSSCLIGYRIHTAVKIDWLFV
jgi:hypothetical protein